MIEIPELIARVAIAVAIGALIGVEREQREQRKFAGLRTLALLGGAGPVAVAITQIEGESLFVVLYLVLAIGIAFGVAATRLFISNYDFGFTTTVTVFIVALLGVLVGYGRVFEATSIAIVTGLLLAERDRLHHYVNQLSNDEISDSLTLGALVFILYPILPNEAIDPFEILIPQDVLLFAIFVLLIEFSSYVTMQQLGGSKGLAVTGLLAGGANSFAAAGVLARMANQSEDAVDAASLALLLATFTMIVRNIGIAVVLAIGLAGLIWQPAIVMGGLTLVAAIIVWHIGDTHENLGIDLDSPFSLYTAVKFALAYTIILFVSVGAEEWLGDIGLLGTAFTGGLVSSAAVSVTAATIFSEGTVPHEIAVGMVVLSIVASLTSKIVLVELVNGDMRRHAVVPMTLIGVSGLVTIIVTLL